MARLERGDFEAVSWHHHSRAYVELPEAGGGVRHKWSQPVPGLALGLPAPHLWLDRTAPSRTSLEKVA